MSREEYAYKRRAITVAKDLCYSEKVINKLRNAKSEKEITTIMCKARKGEL